MANITNFFKKIKENVISNAIKMLGVTPKDVKKSKEFDKYRHTYIHRSFSMHALPTDMLCRAMFQRRVSRADSSSSLAVAVGAITAHMHYS